MGVDRVELAETTDVAEPTRLALRSNSEPALATSPPTPRPTALARRSNTELTLRAEASEAIDVHSHTPTNTRSSEVQIEVKPPPEPQQASTPLNQKQEYYLVLLGGVCLAFNAGYINGICLTGMLAEGKRQTALRQGTNGPQQVLRHSP